MHCNMWAVAHTVRELEMNPGSSVLPLALEEFDVLASPSAESPCRLLSRTTTLRLATEQDAVSILPIPCHHPQTIPPLFPVCGLLCYAYSNTKA